MEAICLGLNVLNDWDFHKNYVVNVFNDNVFCYQ